MQLLVHEASLQEQLSLQINYAAALDLVRMRSFGGGRVVGSALLVGNPLMTFLTGLSDSREENGLLRTFVH
jgi:hypothetical protein